MESELEERMISAETHLAHQEATLAELSDVLAEQWQAIRGLKEKVGRQPFGLQRKNAADRIAELQSSDCG